MKIVTSYMTKPAAKCKHNNPDKAKIFFKEIISLFDKSIAGLLQKTRLK